MTRCVRCGLRLALSATRCPRDGLDVAVSPVEVPRALSPPAIAGYELGTCLGLGGFGAVFSARRTKDGQGVAVKVCHREPREARLRLDHEITVLIELGPTLAPAVYSAGESDGQGFCVMERLQGRTLAEVVEDSGAALALGVFRPLARKLMVLLEEVHRRGWGHGDLKPDNIFVERDDGLRLIDFGTAYPLAQAPIVGVDGRETKTETVGAGTAEYMSPEQCGAKGTVDARSDIYAVGVVLYELVSGAPPFWGSAAEVRESHRSRRPALPAGAPPEVAEVILKCLAKDPGERYGDMAELRGALDVALTLAEDARRKSEKPLREAPSQGRGPEKRLLSVMHFVSKDAPELSDVLTRLGGRLAYKSGGLSVAIFGHEASDNPVRAAMVAAHACIARSLFRNAIIDVTEVHIQPTRDGGSRYLSPIFAKRDRYPSADDPAGVLLTQAAAEVLPELEMTPAGRGLFQIGSVDRRDETIMAKPHLLLGRDEMLRDLMIVAQEGRQNRRTALARITAPAGYGKTHLAVELGRRLETAKLDVLRLRPAEYQLPGSRLTTQQLLISCAALPPEAPSDGGKELWHELLGAPLAQHTWAAGSLTLEWISDQHPEVQKLRAAPGALRNALARITAELLKRKARAAPTALIVDSAHLADDAALDAIELAVATEDDCALSVFALARPSFENDRPHWGERASTFRRIELGPLDSDAAGQLARRLLEPAENVPPWALQKLVDRTEGVPGLLVELVRGLHHEGLIRRYEKGTGHYLAAEVLARLPDMPILKWSTSREVEALPVELTAHARLASVLGRPFSGDELDRLLRTLDREGQFEDVALDAGVGITRLLESGILVRRRGGLFDFRSALLRDAVYASTPQAFRTRVHHAAYQLYAHHPEGHSLEIMSRLALHAGRSGQPGEATRWYLAVAQKAIERQLYQDAILVLDAALEQAKDDPASMQRIHYQRGMSRFRLGRFEDAAKDFETAATLAKAAQQAVAQTESLLAQATMADWMHQLDRSNGMVEEARVICPPSPPARLEVEMLMAAGRARYRANDHEGASVHLTRAIAQAEALGDEGYEVYVISLLLYGYTAAVLGKLDEGEAAFARAVEAAESRHDQPHLAAALNNRIGLWFGRADTERLFEDLKRVLEIAKESGLSHMEGPVQSNFGEALYCLGDLEAAELHGRRALEAHARVGASVRTVNTAALLMARIHLYRGELDASRAELQAIDARSSTARREGENDFDLVGSDRAVLEGVRLSLGGTDPGAWDRLFASDDATRLAPHERADLWEMRAFAESRAGRAADGIASLERALELSQGDARIIASRIERHLDQSRAELSA